MQYPLYQQTVVTATLKHLSSAVAWCVLIIASDFLLENNRFYFSYLSISVIDVGQ